MVSARSVEGVDVGVSGFGSLIMMPRTLATLCHRIMLNASAASLPSSVVRAVDEELLDISHGSPRSAPNVAPRSRHCRRLLWYFATVDLLFRQRRVRVLRLETILL